MNTEINGNWGAYIKRFQLPSKKCFIYPLKSALIIFSAQLVVSMVYFLPIVPFAKFLILFIALMTSIGYYMKVQYREFWNIVLEESKGLFADMLMWIYYIILCVFSLIHAFFYFYLSDGIIK
jgi:hypothetical protein